MRYFRILALFLLLFPPLLSALHAGEPQRELVCKQCNMKLTDEHKRFSVIVPAGIEFSAFDDLGCAMLWKAGECAMRQGAFDDNAVAHDQATGREVPVQKAFFVIGSGVRTPMGFGVLAFGSKEAAEEFIAAQKQGTIVSYADMETFILEQQKRKKSQGGYGESPHHDAGQMQHPEQHP